MTGGFERGELGALRHQERQGVGQVWRLGRQNRHAEVEIVDQQANRVFVHRVSRVGHAVDGDGLIGHMAVAIGVLQIRAPHANEGLDVVSAKFDAVGAHAFHRAE